MSGFEIYGDPGQKVAAMATEFDASIHYHLPGINRLRNMTFSSGTYSFQVEAQASITPVIADWEGSSVLSC